MGWWKFVERMEGRGTEREEREGGVVGDVKISFVGFRLALGWMEVGRRGGGLLVGRLTRVRLIL